MQTLPVELIGEIANYVASFSLHDVGSLARVCKRYRANVFPRLESLRVPASRDDDKRLLKFADTYWRQNMELAPPPQLTDLSLQGCSRLSDTGFAVVGDTLPGLRSLSISRCQTLTGRSLQETVALQLTRLTRLDVSGLQLLADNCFSELTRLQSLRLFDCSNCPNIKDSVTQLVRRVTSLQDLRMVGAWSVLFDRESALPFAQAMCAAGASGRLQALHVGRWMLGTGHQGQAQIQVLDRLLSQQTALRTLDLGGSVWLPDSTVASAAVAAGSRLRQLTTTYSHVMTDAAVWVVGQRCPNLVRLSLHGCSGLSPDALAAALPLLTRLRQLDLGQLHKAVDDRVIQAIGPALGPSLHQLSVQGAASVTDLSALVVHLTDQFRELDASHTDLAPDSFPGGSVWAQSCPGLRRLDLGACHRVPGLPVQQLIVQLPSLRHLNVNGLADLTVDQIVAALEARAAAHLPPLEYLGWPDGLMVHNVRQALPSLNSFYK